MSNMKWACEQHFQKRIKYERRNFNSMQRNRNTQKNENRRKNAKRRQILIQLNDYAHCNTVQTYFKCGNSRRYCSLSFHLIHSRVVFNSHHSHKKDRCTYSRCTWIKSSNFVSNTQICHIFPSYSVASTVHILFHFAFCSAFIYSVHSDRDNWLKIRTNKRKKRTNWTG